eukprot:3657533-Pleurochrysis_carterae.AAC.4
MTACSSTVRPHSRTTFSGQAQESCGAGTWIHGANARYKRRSSDVAIRSAHPPGSFARQLQSSLTMFIAVPCRRFITELHALRVSPSWSFCVYALDSPCTWSAARDAGQLRSSWTSVDPKQRHSRQELLAMRLGAGDVVQPPAQRDGKTAVFAPMWQILTNRVYLRACRVAIRLAQTPLIHCVRRDAASCRRGSTAETPTKDSSVSMWASRQPRKSMQAVTVLCIHAVFTTPRAASARAHNFLFPLKPRIQAITTFVCELLAGVEYGRDRWWTDVRQSRKSALALTCVVSGARRLTYTF